MDKEPRSVTGDLITTLKDLAVIAFFYVVFTTVGWASFHIPSGSMEPTLEVGDRIFVSKFSYGYNRFSFYFDPPIFEEKIFESKPERGDVAVFTLPYKDYTDYIKRVIGLPGDRIQMKAGRLYINGKVVKRTYVRDVEYTSYNGFELRVKEYIEELPGGVKHRIYERTDRGRADDTPLYVVPEGHYFMMGDNRDGSADSREMDGIGFVASKYIVGRADITTFSLYDCDQGKDVYCPAGIPLGRFFKGL
ncbi:signal peptidase I [Kordiimonas sediminis]|uniref:Signal peptidase I n=1 Tax=Kordiimonas sediminis TaxID=1735581 RepID=A0A919AMT9_9PROT|nr:signal peptidase I [Kordiimonas sediminis]GHF15462.1 signal peptidase I [Kordiimonas sediminis]